jgi:hypothetical protein
MFRAHETIPPSEVKSKIIMKRGMMEIMIGVAPEPTEPFASLGGMSKQLNAGMAKSVSNHHERHGDEQRRQLHRNE